MLHSGPLRKRLTSFAQANINSLKLQGLIYKEEKPYFHSSLNQTSLLARRVDPPQQLFALWDLAMEQRVDPRSEPQQRASANHSCQPCLSGERELSPLQPRQLVWRDYSRRSWCRGAEWGFTPDRRPCWSDRTRLRLSWSFSYLKPPAGGKLKQAQIQKIYIYELKIIMLIKGIEKMGVDVLSMQAMSRVRSWNKNTIQRLIQNPKSYDEGPS